MRRTLPLLATVVMLAGLLSLGFWQVERLAWKEDLLARIEQRVSAEPLVLASADDLTQLRRAHMIIIRR